MTFLFKRNPKNPHELVRALNEQLQKLDGSYNPAASVISDSTKKYQDECARYIKQVKVVLHGDDETDPQPDQISVLAQEIYSSDCLLHLIVVLRKLDFDSRKDVSIIFLTLLRRQIGSKSPTVDYLLLNPEILIVLMRGAETKETGLICGQILRDCIKYEQMLHFVIYNPLFWKFFDYVQIPVFEIATDAFTTLHDVLTLHKKIASEFLGAYYSEFTKRINQLVQSNNYVTKRQSVKLLSELVLERRNQTFLNAYFDDTNNLKLIMILLSDKLKNLQIEAFHIFKFFIAKPKKCQGILDILIKNKENFIAFFDDFQLDSTNDPTMIDERDYILKEIKGLPDIERIQ